ncbi:hypothetical protein [Hyphomonas sp.]|jgi:hypothetical protein|uniref:hypothetical protein n=1 Tax=Hyphomonas sp. TaxID=87 RepID=UPI0037C126E3
MKLTRVARLETLLQVTMAEDVSDMTNTSGKHFPQGELNDKVQENFVAFCDEIMSLYGNNKDSEMLEALSSTPPAELQKEHDKVSYRILWLEALLNESRLELELIRSVLDSSDLNTEP